MAENLAESMLLSRPQLIKMTGSKKLIDQATHSGSLPVIKVGKDGSQRPRHLYLRVDVERWLRGLAQGGEQ